MGLIILLAFIVTPIVEIALFIEAGDRFGLWPTLGAVILTAIVGTQLLRSQGLATWARATRSLQRNEFPIAEVFTGLCLVLAGALLLTPGFLTDTVGFLLMAPPLRRIARDRLWRLISKAGGGGAWINGEEVTGPGPAADAGTIEGEYREVDPDASGPPDDPPKRPR